MNSPLHGTRPIPQRSPQPRGGCPPLPAWMYEHDGAWGFVSGAIAVALVWAGTWAVGQL